MITDAKAEAPRGSTTRSRTRRRRSPEAPDGTADAEAEVAPGCTT